MCLFEGRRGKGREKFFAGERWQIGENLEEKQAKQKISLSGNC